MKQWKHLKQDDGYVLIYVLVVFTILSFVAVSICTTALKNLQTQQADVARMGARYEAEGYLQQFIAEVEAIEGLQGGHDTEASLAKDAMKTVFLNTVKEIPAEEGMGSWLTIEEGSAPEELILKIKDKDDAVQIDATLMISLVSETEGGEPISGSNPVEYAPYVCTLKKASVSGYESYDISYQSAENAEGEVSE